ncbi:MAG: dihydrofolate reductase [bacterium]
MTVQMVAARSLNNVIGKGTEIPWHVKGEQKIFKKVTMGGTLIMGRVTFDSIGRPLPGRTTIIVTHRTDYQQQGCLIANNLDMAMQLATDLGKPIFIAGGGEIYKQSLALTEIVHLTTIDTTVEGDVFFPAFPNPDFELVEEQSFESNIDYTYQKFQRKRSADSGQLSNKPTKGQI